MVTQVSGDPTTVNLLSWSTFGGTALFCVTNNDDATSYIRRAAQPGGTDENDSAYAEFIRAFTGLPANAQVTRVGLLVRWKGDLDSKLLNRNIQGQGWWVPWGAPGTSYATTAVTWQTVSGLSVDGSGNFTASCKVALSADWLNTQGANITWAQVYLEYNQIPNAPTLTSPSGTVATLTPTFTGTHNDPDGDSLSQVEIEVRRVSDNALMWSAVTVTGTFSIGYAGSTLVNGTQYKWRARTDDSSSGTNFGAWSSFTTFTPVTNNPPVATVVAPTGGAAVGSLTPTLQFSYYDVDGNVQSGYQIQVRRSSDLTIFWDPGQVASSATSVVYAGTTLVGGTTYEWRVRVQDSVGDWSLYTSWAQFQPQAIPNAPTLSSPSGLTNTLTPTIQGAYSQGGGGTESAFQYEIKQNEVTIYQSGDIATVIATGQAFGTNNPSDTPSTPPTLSWGTTYYIRARSKDNAAQYSSWMTWQEFHTNSAPTSPTNLSPDGSVTGDTTPDITWVHNDVDGDAQTQADIELRNVGTDAVVGAYGPLTLTQATLTHTVGTVLTASPATAYKYRIRTKGLAGAGFGAWSDWKTFTVATAPSVTVTVPTIAQVLLVPTLTATWSLSGGSGTQATYRVKMFEDDQVTVVYDSGILSGTNTTQDVGTTTFRNNQTYYVQVYLTDTLAQACQSDLIAISTSWTPPATITGISVVAVASQELK